MPTVADLIERLTPVLDLAGSWDPVGLQVGDADAALTSVAVCHEVTDDVVAEAVALGSGVVVAYHPLIFEPVVRFVAGVGPVGRAWRLAGAGVGLVVVHTGWDAAIGGTADSLSHALGIDAPEPFGPVSSDPGAAAIGRVGTRTTNVGDLAELAAVALGSPSVRVGGDRDRGVRRIAVLPGSGGGFVEAAAAAGADVLVTGDVGHHRAVEAACLGMAVIDVGHVPSERPGVAALAAWLREVDLAPVADLTHLVTNPWEVG